MFRVPDSRFKVQGSRFKVQGSSKVGWLLYARFLAMNLEL
jgi:hypothetical protein